MLFECVVYLFNMCLNNICKPKNTTNNRYKITLLQSPKQNNKGDSNILILIKDLPGLMLLHVLCLTTPGKDLLILNIYLYSFLVLKYKSTDSKYSVYSVTSMVNYLSSILKYTWNVDTHYSWNISYMVLN